ncbi:unnamed protein product [Pleuronectes platessa]|uniref:Uncharacterized protein n=1 Tax=Pleuronectes platessa TaxID=8262 RepID=A0A9N7VP93_PLEPL|nr:unnamed protein product [Pleuronectes platessa]
MCNVLRDVVGQLSASPAVTGPIHNSTIQLYSDLTAACPPLQPGQTPGCPAPACPGPLLSAHPTPLSPAPHCICTAHLSPTLLLDLLVADSLQRVSRINPILETV